MATRKKKAPAEAPLAGPEGPAKGIDALTLVPPVLQEAMILSIRTHGGAEVLFHGQTGPDGRLASVRDVAHGSAAMVPALTKGLRAGDVFIHNHPSGRLMPSDADVQTAAILADQGVGTWIVNNEVDRLTVVVEPWVPETAGDFDEDQVAAIFDADGPMATYFPHYRVRSGQVAMVRAVTRGFADEAVVAVEAGTGVGKSFAYLVPAILWALHHKERVVVSTATINLQQQLVDKDIPAVQRILGRDLKAVLVKGRGNYLCIKRLGEAVDEEGLLLEPEGVLGHINAWAKTTKDGSRSDLPFVPSDVEWSRVNADADNCPGLRCPHKDQCFFFQARREAAGAQIVVANHHLVFADAAMRNRGMGFEATVVLPAYQRIIFDEAHNIEEAATSFFSDTLNRFVILKYLAILHRKKRSAEFGLLPALQALGLIDIPSPEALLQGARDAALRLDAVALHFLGEEGTLRLEGKNRESLQPLMDQLKELQGALKTLGDTLKDAVDGVDTEEPVPAVEELDILARRLQALGALCGSFCVYHQHPDRVYYLEKRRNPGGDFRVDYVASPLEVGDLLRDSILEPYRTVVLTSATLRVDQSFRYFFQRLGLELQEAPAGDGFSDSFEADPDSDGDEAPGSGPQVVQLRGLERPVLTLAAASPFDYQGRTVLGVPMDAPDPSDSRYQDWLQDFVLQSLEAAGGHALVLFTSYDMLQKTYRHVAPRLAERGIEVYRQGDEQRSQLLARFNAKPSSCLLATDSFWEGVDSPGESLQLVILCKLPFRVPTEPLAQARREALESRGGNPFMHLSLPEAVMKFRQGFGRLMRREDDWGVVIVADPRIVGKFYGKSFLRSLPRIRVLRGPSDWLSREAASFLERFRTED